VSCSAIEATMDACARAIDMDPAEFRRLNFRREGVTPTGVQGGGLSHEACLNQLLSLMDYKNLRETQRRDRDRPHGRCLGIGFATFTEQNAPGPGFYGAAGVKISAQEGCTLRLEPSGSVTCITSNPDQGQGVETALAQLIADELGLPLASVRIVGGDTAMTAVGGGSFASRGLTIAGEAVLRAARLLAERIEALRRATGIQPIADLAALMNYKQHALPAGVDADPAVTVHFTMKHPFLLANGIQASFLQVDTETGIVTLLKHWVVEDCGRVINPLLADEQLRGGVVQGLGAALYEECLYDENAQLLNGSMADYLVPMAGEMPDIVIRHVETPVPDMALGAKGIGEAGTIGAAAAVGNAINDALAPFGAEILELPCTPQRILRALGRVR